jgi:hypothetical protein
LPLKLQGGALPKISASIYSDYWNKVAKTCSCVEDQQRISQAIASR